MSDWRTHTVGLDLSFSNTGVGWYENGRLEWAEFSTKPKDGSVNKRAEYIADGVAELADGLGFLVAMIETPVMGSYGRRRSKAADMLVRLRTLVEMRLEDREIPFGGVTSSQIKLFAAGHGKADKEDVVAAWHKVEPEIPGDDVADALTADCILRQLLRLGHALAPCDPSQLAMIDRFNTELPLEVISGRIKERT